MPIIEMRPFQAADVSAVQAVIADAVSTMRVPEYTNELLDSKIAYYSPQTLLEHAQTKYVVVAVIDGQIEGTGAIEGDNISGVFVRPSHQNIGIGKHIMRALETYAREQGLPSIRLSSSFNAEQFYERLGYIRQSVEPLSVNMVKTISQKPV